jgi:hypothetical protein
MYVILCTRVISNKPVYKKNKNSVYINIADIKKINFISCDPLPLIYSDNLNSLIL